MTTEAEPPIAPATSIIPDSKDWTWVLERVCPECRFDASTLSFTDVPRLVLDNAGRWADVLAGPDVAVRPRSDRWSPLEYACHVRDVLMLYDFRLHLMLDEDAPDFPNWDQDETAVAERYGDQDPATVANELSSAAETISASLSAVRDDQRWRTGTRSDGVEFTIDTFARYFVHDPIHHLWDVTGHLWDVTG